MEDAKWRRSTNLITLILIGQTLSGNARRSGLMFHSDRGTQYTSKTFQNLLRMNKVVQSLSNPGMPHDNAVAEAFFATMKKEELYRTRYRSVREISKSIDEYVRFYNTERPHSTLAYKTPVKFEALCGNAGS